MLFSLYKYSQLHFIMFLEIYITILTVVLFEYMYIFILFFFRIQWNFKFVMVLQCSFKHLMDLC